MDKEMRKRLEKAAEEYAETYKASLQKTAFRSFVAGAEHGYKEAIKQAKEWIERANATLPACYNSFEIDTEKFETDMNELWEEKK